MQSSRQTSGRVQRGTAPVAHRRRPASPAIVRPASHVLAIAPASQLSLPSLAGVPTDFKLSNETEKLAPIAAALVKRGYATRADWELSRHDLTEFISAGLSKLLAAHGSQAVDDHMELYCGLTDEQGYRTTDGMFLILEVGNCGYIQVGRFLDVLENTAKGLGAAYYAHLTGALYSFCDTYDFWRAEQYRNYQIEGIMDEHDFGTKDPDKVTDQQIEEAGYDVVQPREAIPGRVLATVENPSKGRTKKATALLKRYRKAHPELIEPLLKMLDVAARYRPLRMQDGLEESPLPSFLVCFEAHDAISQAFDEYAQTAMESDQACVFRVGLAPDSPKTITAALNALEMVMDLYSNACALAAIFRPEDEELESYR